eukprot:1985807-Prymnesium_polylepis.1
MLHRSRHLEREARGEVERGDGGRQLVDQVLERPARADQVHRARGSAKGSEACSSGEIARRVARRGARRPAHGQ